MTIKYLLSSLIVILFLFGQGCITVPNHLGVSPSEISYVGHNGTENDTGLSEPANARYGLAAEELPILAATIHPFPYCVFEFLPLEDTNVARHIVSADSITLLDTSVLWISRIIKEEWLPDTIKERLICVNDYPYYWTYTGDYILLEYSHSNHRIYINDDGILLTLTVLYPDTFAINPGDPKEAIWEQMNRFTYFPNQEVKTTRGTIKQDSGIYYGVIYCNLAGGNDIDSGGYLKDYLWWWQQIKICTDGSFLSISFPEINGSPVNAQRVSRTTFNRF